MKDIVTLLKTYVFFEGFTEDQLKLVAKDASEVSFKADSMIIREGQKADKFYLIKEGHVIIKTRGVGRRDFVIQTLGSGDILGWSWLSAPHKWRFTAQAIFATRAIAFNGERLRRLCSKDPDLGYLLLTKFSNIMIERLQGTRIQLLDLYGLPVGGV